MSRLFDTVIIEEELPKFLIVGESAVSDLLVTNLLSGGAQVYYLKNGAFQDQPNLYKIKSSQIKNISQSISYVFFETEPEARLEEELKGHLENARFMYLNPRLLKKNAIMFFAPFVYGPGVTDKSFGFLALNENSIVSEKTLIFPQNLDQEVRPIFAADLVNIVEKVMFSGGVNELYLLLGKESISIVTFLGNLRGRLKFDVATRYLVERLSFHIPSAGQTEHGVTPLEKGIKETTAWLNASALILPTPRVAARPTSAPKINEIPITPPPPKNIPSVENFEKNGIDFSLDNNFIKRIYHDNLNYLKDNNLINEEKKQSEKIKLKEHIFAVSFAMKKKHFFAILANIVSKFKHLIRSLKNPLKSALNLKNNAFSVFFKIISVAIPAIFIISLPWVIYVITLITSLFFLKNSAVALSRYDLKISDQHRKAGEIALRASRTVHQNILKYYYQAARADLTYKNEEALFEFEENGFKILKSGQNALDNLSRALPLILNVKKGEGVDDYVGDAVLAARDARDTFSSVVGRLKHEVPAVPWFLKFKQNEYFAFLNKTPQLYQELNKTNLFLQKLPDILGKSSRKTYAILFQNNMELRSTGGFIGSYALISFEKEKLLDFSVMDVYDADGQLKGKVQPPAEILHFLGQTNWFLRDSNVNPNFPDAAREAIWFIGKETSVDLDGVMAIDISTIENVLKVTGPIHLSDFNVTVTSGNLFEKAEKAAEQNFFPGSTKKKDFLKSLGEALWANISRVESDKIFKLLKTGLDAGATRHFQAYFADREIEDTIKFLKIDGTLLKTDGSYLNIIENNYGANKVNYFLRRTINHQIKILPDGFVEHELKVRYENQSPLGSWPAGPYKAYVKFYLSPDSLYKTLNYEGKKPVLSEALNEKVLEKIKVATEQLVLAGEENGLKYFGTLINVPVKEAQEIVFSWQAAAADTNNLKKYEFYFQKQAGSVNEPYNLTVLFPENLIASSNIAPHLASKGSLKYNLSTEKDIDLEINFK